MLPNCTVEDALSRIFPASRGSGLLEGEAQAMVSSVLESGTGGKKKQFHEIPILNKATSVHHANGNPMSSALTVSGGKNNNNSSNSGKISLSFSIPQNGNTSNTQILTLGGSFPSVFPLADGSTLLPHQATVLAGMLQSSAIDQHVCLIGARGEGKTFISKWYAAALGYVQVESLFLFEDMTARDLFNRRSTNSVSIQSDAGAM